MSAKRMLIGQGRSASSADVGDDTFGRKVSASAPILAHFFSIAARRCNGTGSELPGGLGRNPRLCARRVRLFGLKRIDHPQQGNGSDNASHL